MRVVSVAKVIIGTASYLCVCVSVCTLLSLCLGIQIREADYIREDEQEQMETEGGRGQLCVVDVGAQAGLDPPRMCHVPSAEHHVC